MHARGGLATASSSSAAHRGHGDYGDGAMEPHQCLDGGASCSGRWSESRWSYLRDKLNGGATVVASEAGDDTTTAALRLALK